MRDAEIERLLGGYATGTLTGSERQALFAAALDDQELFNALQNEEPLRELLNDAPSRKIIARALNQSENKVTPFWRRHGWAWGLAACAAATGALVFILLPSRTTTSASPMAAIHSLPKPVETPAPTAQLAQEPTPSFARDVPGPEPKRMRKSEQLPAHEVRRAEGRLQQESSNVAQTSSAAQVQSTAPSQQTVQQNQAADSAAVAGAPAPPPQKALRSQAFAPGGVGGYLKSASGEASAIPYSLLKRDALGAFLPLVPGEALREGDAVRLLVRVPSSGSLTLSGQNAAGAWMVLYPATGAGLAVSANQEYILPETALQVNGPHRLRIQLTAEAEAGKSGLEDAAKEALGKPKQRLASDQARILVTEITLAPGRP